MTTCFCGVGLIVWQGKNHALNVVVLAFEYMVVQQRGGVGLVDKRLHTMFATDAGGAGGPTRHFFFGANIGPWKLGQMVGDAVAMTANAKVSGPGIVQPNAEVTR